MPYLLYFYPCSSKKIGHPEAPGGSAHVCLPLYHCATHLKLSRWRVTSQKDHWSEGSLVQISEWPYYAYIWVRTILALGYWVLGNIHRYWVVLLLGDIFWCSDTQYNTNQIASEQLFSSTCDLYSDRRNRLSGHHDDMLLFIKHNHCHHHRVLGFFCGHCYALHKYRYWYWVLVSLEANIIGDWILGAFLGIVLTLAYIWKAVQCFLIPKLKHHDWVTGVMVRVRACHLSD